MPARWRGYLETAAKAGNTSAYRHCGELCTLLALRDAGHVRARALSRYFAHDGLSTYTHVTDQHTTYRTKIIVATKCETHYVLDEILGNATDIPVTEHATDTHGVTLVNFRTVRPARPAGVPVPAV